MKSFALVTAAIGALVGGVRTARAEITAAGGAAHDAAILRGAPMSGPYTTAFDDKCAELRDAPMRGEATCKRVRAMRVGRLRAEIHRVGWADGSGDYYLALRTKAGWFVSDVPLEIESGDGHAGHYDIGEIASIAVGEEKLGASTALSLQIRETWRTYCDECATAAERGVPERAYGTSATMVCGVGAGGAPTCTAPLYTMGDDDHPPRVVAGKLVARGVLVGEATEYGQEWHDLADDDYAITL
jgi:hypothetical protein